MKYVLIIPDGAADQPQKELGNLTPLQAADIPHMDAIASAGIVGQVDHVPQSMPSGSDVGTMTLFGYDTLKYHTGRAPIEAAARGIALGENDWAIRCNLVTVEDGCMKSFTAEQITSELGAELIQLLQKECCGNNHWKFHTGVSYRNLLLYRSQNGIAPFCAETTTIPPHDILDQPIEKFLPSGPGSEELRKLMLRSVDLFLTSKKNKERTSNGELPATQIWLWGEGRVPQLENFKDRFGVTGAVITAVDLLRGMGKLLGWEIVEVAGATGYTDTDYAAKATACIEKLADVDFVVVHVEATDEASHEGDVTAKVKALEEIDAKIVAPVYRYLQQQGDFRILISPDHPTFLKTRTHSHGYVPFAIAGNGINPNTPCAYNEVAAKQSDITFDKGHELMPMFLELVNK